MMYESLDNRLTGDYAASVYDNPQCMTREEFAEDYKRFRYVKRLCKRYLALQRLKKQDTWDGTRLLLNHLILLTNMFGVEATVRILFVKCETDKMWRVLKPFLVAERYLPEVVRGVNGTDIYTDDIPLDEKLLARIRDVCSTNGSPNL